MACTSVHPPTRASLCDYDAYFGELSVLFITLVGDGLTDWTDETEWDTRIDNTTAQAAQDPALIRALFGIGSMGKPEKTKVKFSRRREVFSAPKYTFEFVVDDTGTANWAWARAIPTAGQTFTGWVGTEDRLFGGNAGLQLTVSPSPNIPGSSEELITLIIDITFEGSIPEVTDMPAIAALTA